MPICDAPLEPNGCFLKYIIATKKSLGKMDGLDAFSTETRGSFFRSRTRVFFRAVNLILATLETMFH